MHERRRLVPENREGLSALGLQPRVSLTRTHARAQLCSTGRSFERTRTLAPRSNFPATLSTVLPFDFRSLSYWTYCNDEADTENPSETDTDIRQLQRLQELYILLFPIVLFAKQVYNMVTLCVYKLGKVIMWENQTDVIAYMAVRYTPIRT